MKKNSFLVLDHFFESISLLKKHKEDLARMSLLPSAFILLALFLPTMDGKFLAVMLLVLSGFAFYICTCRLFYGKDVGRNFTRLSYKGVFWRTLLAGVYSGLIKLAFLFSGIFVLSLIGVIFLGVFSVLTFGALGDDSVIFPMVIAALYMIGSVILDLMLFPMTLAAAVGDEWSFERVLRLTKGRYWFVFKSFFIVICFAVLWGLGALCVFWVAHLFNVEVLFLGVAGVLVSIMLPLFFGWLSAFSMQIYKALVNQSKESSAKEGPEV